MAFAQQMTEGEIQILQYNKNLIKNAKYLRKEATPWERKLWFLFLRHYPIRFQRQKTILNFIVDFYCAKAKIVIELDGSGHYTEEQMLYDRRRTEQLNTLGLTVIRFTNLDVDNRFRFVCENIDLAVKQSLPQSASLTAPSSEGAK